MAKPVDLRNITDSAVDVIAAAIAAANPTLDATQLQAAVEAALAAAEPLDVNIVGGTFSTGTEAIPAPPTVTQLPSVATPAGAVIRAGEDMYIYNTATPGASDGFLVYEGDGIRITSITNLDQIYVMPTKNQPITLWWLTL